MPATCPFVCTDVNGECAVGVRIEWSSLRCQSPPTGSNGKLTEAFDGLLSLSGRCRKTPGRFKLLTGISLYSTG